MIIPALAALLLTVPAHGQTIQCPEGQTYRYGTCYPDKALLDNSPAPAKPAAAPPADSPAGNRAGLASVNGSLTGLAVSGRVSARF